MPKAAIKVPVGDDEEIVVDVGSKLSNGFVKVNLFTPEGRMGLTFDPPIWQSIIDAIKASIEE